MYRSAFLSGLLLRIVSPFDALESQTLAQARISIKLCVRDAIRAYPLAIGVAHVQALLRFLTGFAAEILAHFHIPLIQSVALKIPKALYHFLCTCETSSHRRNNPIADFGLRNAD